MHARVYQARRPSVMMRQTTPSLTLSLLCLTSSQSPVVSRRSIYEMGFDFGTSMFEFTKFQGQHVRAPEDGAILPALPVRGG